MTADERALYNDAVDWIGENDDSAVMNLEDVSHQMTVHLVADLFGVKSETVARAVVKYRRGHR
jgi:hypothetical protein